MKKTTFFMKAFMLLTMMILGFVMPLTAQTDGFFKSNNDVYEDRDGTTIGGGDIFNQQFGEQLPLGSGLLILAAAGAGYAVARRRRSLRKTGAMIMALAMVLTFTQCKKNAESIITNNQGHTFVRLTIEDDSKHQINLTGSSYEDGLGKVEFETGDFIWVVNGDKISGKLTYDGVNKVFQGYIDDNPTGAFGDITLDQDDYLHFYYTSNIDMSMFAFLTGLVYLDQNYVNTYMKYAFLQDISSQNKKLPVMSYGHTENLLSSYSTEELQHLSCKLLNKCALVKFELPETTAEDVRLVDVYNQCRFAVNKADQNSLTACTDKRGVITLYNPSGTTASDVRWGILLPGETTEQKVDVVVGNKLYKEAATIPVLNNNDLVDAVSVTLGTSQTLPSNAIFNSSTRGWIEIAKGNLQYSKSTSAYGIVSPSYTLVETGTSVEADYGQDGVISLFSWDAWNKNNTAPYLTSGYTAPTQFVDFDSNITLDGVKGWRTMSENDMKSIFFERGDAYYSATVGGTYGIILLSDVWTGTLGTTAVPGMNGWNNVVISAADWATYESNGAIFLPVCGTRDGISLNWWSNDNHLYGKGFYWRSELSSDGQYGESRWIEDGTQWYGSNQGVSTGGSVRLIRDVNY